MAILKKIMEYARNWVLGIKEFYLMAKEQYKQVKKEIHRIQWSSKEKIFKSLGKFIIVAIVAIIVLFIIDKIIITMLKILF